MDIEHLQLATRLGRLIITHDSDFLKFHNDGHEHSGIAFSPMKITTKYLIRGILLIFQILEPEEMKGHVEFI